MMSELSIDRPTRWPRATYVLALALLALVFGLFVPYVAYQSGMIQADFDAEYPPPARFIIQTSPWIPWLIAILGIAGLVVKERLCGANVSRRTNMAAIVSAALLGAAICVVLFLPLITMIESLHIETGNEVEGQTQVNGD